MINLLVQIGVSSPIRICLLYNPPNANHDYTNDLLTFLRTLIVDSTPLIIMGDFNMPDVTWYTLSGHSGFSNQLCDLAFKFNSLLISLPTFVVTFWILF